MRLLLLILTLVWQIRSQAATIVVAQGGAVTTLEKALQLAAKGDTIFIKKGTYRCVGCMINKPVTVKGESGAILDGGLLDEGLIVMADNVTIQNVEVKNTKIGSIKDYAGIRVMKSRNVSVLNCVLTNCFFGIYFSDSKRGKIWGNHLVGANYGKSNTGNGIHLWKCDSVDIRNNFSEGHRDGIYFEFAKYCTISNNTCKHNFRYGLHFMFSDNDTYIGNVFSNNGTGVAVMYSHGIVMRKNRFECNWGDASYGLLLKDISASTINENVFFRNTIGVTMEGCSRINFRTNELQDNGYALRVWANCINDTFQHNNFCGNSFDATTNGELQLNSFDYNYWDKYEGYDLNKDKIGDVPYHPVSMFSMLIQDRPYAVILMHSFIVNLFDRAEKSIPSMTPNSFFDGHPLMKKYGKI